MRNVTILGSTGSIGKQTLEVISQLPGFKAVALTGGKNENLIEKQVRKFKPGLVASPFPEICAGLRVRLADTPVKVTDDLREAAAFGETDTVVAAISGIAGLAPTLAAVESGKRVALANKESLVCAGHIIKESARKSGAEIIPVDSEHSAIFRCLQGIKGQRPHKIWLTASGGPFFGKKRDELQDITPESALKHPNWSMGKKVTIDSATLFNKGLEFIEAMELFEVKPQDIEILIHRQSVVHSMVEFEDGSFLAQCGVPDMKVPIQYALTFPEIKPNNSQKQIFPNYRKWEFDFPDLETFSCLRIAKEVSQKGCGVRTAMNAGDETAVEMFLTGKSEFLKIPEIISRAIELAPENADTLSEILEIDKNIREIIKGE